VMMGRAKHKQPFWQLGKESERKKKKENASLC